jgi:hypothetical protein
MRGAELIYAGALRVVRIVVCADKFARFRQTDLTT